MNRGERIKLDLFTPVKSEFNPNIVVTGPGIKSTDVLPEGVEIPEGMGFIIIESKLGEAEYEPFTPASYYYLSDAIIPVTETGTYYVGVFDFDNEGKYGLAIGYVEKFSISEWIGIPISVTRIRIWEGQNLLVVLAPLFFTVIIGLIALYMNQKTKNNLKTLFGFLMSFAGLLYIGSGISVFYQMINAFTKAFSESALITAVFASIPIVLGITIFGYTSKVGPRTVQTKLSLLLLSGLGLIFWAGMILGPAVVIISAMLPSKKINL
ncbi:MAG: hypothetical protein APG12_01059 [Candidatus Methanofastidiosum methylothiophilum]|uniref:Uncharacterized protein n=1 Tax=Candidatus Methanofastidiosum methylothiophilum TaxID=1705564 RepID=A0A150IL07_9EURY|nr:MAG: hypothetical protein APG10_00602 [Candidatus Methanofastidiosum methylthiophilus]KYC47909.1 MAG: hypothetical protein APG11_00788 [Candidatus Methanofastidiosum methylthiophilus]KYC50066.1 MAG: hypothetical protein APG12_01059 [Candidatus Methanofastidiosum methylthiophilus]